MMAYERFSQMQEPTVKEHECLNEVKRLLDMAHTAVKGGSLVKVISIPLQMQAKHIALYHCTCNKCLDHYVTVSKYL